MRFCVLRVDLLNVKRMRDNKTLNSLKERVSVALEASRSHCKFLEDLLVDVEQSMGVMSLNDPDVVKVTAVQVCLYHLERNLYEP